MKLRSTSLSAIFAFGFAIVFVTLGSAEAAPCKPPQSAALLTGPVYDSIQAECNWIDALNRRDVTRAAAIIDTSFSHVDAGGAIQNRAALLANVAGGRVGKIVLAGVSVPFSAGSTNIVVSTWTFSGKAHRVTDVFFCDVSHTCRYRLIAEQLTIVAQKPRSHAYRGVLR